MDKHGAMAHMHDAHMPIYGAMAHIHGAMAQRRGVYGSHGTLYSSREQVKHTVHMFLWHFMFFNDEVHKVMDHDWYVDAYVSNLNAFIFYATLGYIVHSVVLSCMVCVEIFSLHTGSIMP